MTFWLNGEWREDAAAIRIDDRGFLLADGVFETTLLRNGAPAFLDRHLDRLTQGLDMLGIKAQAPDGLREIIRELTKCNGVDKGDASLRLTITRGSGPRGLAPPPSSATSATILMTCAPAPAKTPSLRTLVVSDRVRPMTGAAAQCKTLGYLENLLAMNDALAAGADDALMVNATGRLACASAANLFAISPDGVVMTPPLREGALGGIVRGVLLEAAASHGVTIAEQPIAPSDLEGCGLFLTNSLIGLAPARLPGTADIEANEIFKRLDACYQDALEDDLRRVAGL